MKQFFLSDNAKTALVISKTFFCAAVLGLVASFQISIMLSPAHASALFAQQNGNIRCAVCHSQQGMTNGTMYPLSSKGSYFKLYRTLGPRVAPVPPYTPPQQPVYPQQPQNSHVAYCSRRYGSYNRATDTYRGYDGYDHRCISPGRRRYNPPRVSNPPPSRSSIYSGMSCNDLWYKRNLIFARNGLCFKTARGRAAFGRGCFPPYGQMGRNDQHEVNKILGAEGTRGCR